MGMSFFKATSLFVRYDVNVGLTCFSQKLQIKQSNMVGYVYSFIHFTAVVLLISMCALNKSLESWHKWMYFFLIVCLCSSSYYQQLLEFYIVGLPFYGSMDQFGLFLSAFLQTLRVSFSLKSGNDAAGCNVQCQFFRCNRCGQIYIFTPHFSSVTLYHCFHYILCFLIVELVLLSSWCLAALWIVALLSSPKISPTDHPNVQPLKSLLPYVHLLRIEVLTCT